jgi:hypothetical protein
MRLGVVKDGSCPIGCQIISERVLKRKGREISLPASRYYPFSSLLEHAHDLVDDAEQDHVICIVLFKRTKCIGMRIEGGEITRPIIDDHVSPVASAASSGSGPGNILRYRTDVPVSDVPGCRENARHGLGLIGHIVGASVVTAFAS